MGNISWYIGCSGFHYKEWKDAFYPPGLAQKNWFQFYAQQFKTLEINSSFYRFPKKETFKKWYDASPDGYVFSVKAPKTFTHFRRFNNSKDLLAMFYDIALDGLKEKLGPVLFQFPGSVKFDEALLGRILKLANPAFRNVLEFRHASWWNNRVLSLLKEAGIAFCGISINNLPNDFQGQLAFSYYRFHGVPNLYYSRYEENFLEQVVQQAINSATQEVFLYFNNTANVHAIDNARFVEKLIAGY